MPDLNDTRAMTVRVDPDLYRLIEDAARDSFRPLSKEAAFRLKRSFERTQSEAAAS